MPVYEYYCTDCRNTFEALRNMSAATEPMECAKCGSAKHVNRTITTFARVGGGIEAYGGTESGGSASPSFGGGGCCGGSCGCG